jgi:hypothetical protein
MSIIGICTGSAKKQVVGFRPVDAADFVDIAEALGGEQGARRPRPLQYRVDGNGGAVKEKARGGESFAGLRHAVLDARDEPRWRRERLSEVKLSRRLVESGDVGERSAHVGRQANSACLPRAQTEAPAGSDDTISARRKGITSPAKRPMDRRHSSRVKSPKANCPTT